MPSCTLALLGMDALSKCRVQCLPAATFPQAGEGGREGGGPRRVARLSWRRRLSSRTATPTSTRPTSGHAGADQLKSPVRAGACEHLATWHQGEGKGEGEKGEGWGWWHGEGSVGLLVTRMWGLTTALLLLANASGATPPSFLHQEHYFVFAPGPLMPMSQITHAVMFQSACAISFCQIVKWRHQK